jgi:hypothetical protein
MDMLCIWRLCLVDQLLLLLFICVDWKMGHVKDTYMQYVTSMDEFVGHCFELLSVLCTDFADSSPHVLCYAYWLEKCQLLQFAMFGLVVDFEKKQDVFGYIYVSSLMAKGLVNLWNMFQW